MAKRTAKHPDTWLQDMAAKYHARAAEALAEALATNSRTLKACRLAEAKANQERAAGCYARAAAL